MKLSLAKALAEAIQAARRPDREGAQPAWYPSSAFGGCDRKAVLKRAGKKGTPFDERTLRLFWMGDQVHAAIQGTIESGLPEGVTLIGHEVEIRDEEFHVAGRIDTLLSNEDDLEVWEYKSIHSGAFEYGDLPYEHHKDQGKTYLAFPATCPECRGYECIGKTVVGPELCGGKGIMPLPKRLRLIYYSKDDARIEVHLIEGTPEIQAEVRAKLTRLEKKYQTYDITGELPPILPLEQKTDKNKDGERVPAFYQKTVKKNGKVVAVKGTPKMDYPHLCKKPCEFYDTLCPIAGWDIQWQKIRPPEEKKAA